MTTEEIKLVVGDAALRGITISGRMGSVRFSVCELLDSSTQEATLSALYDAVSKDLDSLGKKSLFESDLKIVRRRNELEAQSKLLEAVAYWRKAEAERIKAERKARKNRAFQAEVAGTVLKEKAIEKIKNMPEEELEKLVDPED